MNTIFIKALAQNDKQAVLAESVKAHNDGIRPPFVFIVDVSQFSGIPGTPFSYWINDNVRAVFQRHKKFESNNRTAKQGIATADDFRFLRSWWEVPTPNQKWLSFAKGGGFSPFYADLDLVVEWSHEGLEIKEFRDSSGKIRSRPQNLEYSGRRGLTWSLRPSKDGSVRALPENSIFSVMGSSAFVEGDSKDDLLALLAISNSVYFNYLISLLSSRGGEGSGQTKTYDVGCFANTPIPEYATAKHELCALSRSAFEFYYCESAGNELDHAFIAPSSLSKCVRHQNFGSVRSLHDKINEAVGRLYEIQLVDIGNLEETEIDVPDIIKDESENTLHSTKESEFNWMLGCVLGRWDIRYATGERQPPELPDPFDPLPVCPPGMLQNADGLPAASSDVPDDYPLPITWPGILVSDPGHISSEGSSEDIVARVRDALAVIWGDRSAAIEQEACEILGVRTLRDYFAEKKSGGKFFKDHLKRYSKSRRQAPIYWPLSTESGAYTLWIYYHRLTGDTLFACITNFVAPKIEQVDKDLTRLQQLQQSGQADAKTTDEIGKLTDQLKELRDFQDELKRIAKFWKPNLNDGVQITAAPLWSLFRLKPWQKKLKDTWNKLEKGDYDWAHLAYSIWPERVQEKCKKDKSLAIAHDLEHACVEPPAKKKGERK